jgi:predicted ATP-grasp superfamily ATP-dependent carboligase
VVAGGYYTGVVLMRNLARRGVEVSCIDSNPRMPGFKTVYGMAYRCPNPDEQPRDWVDFMLQLATKLGGCPVLIASSDRFIGVVGDNAAELRQSFVFPEASIAVQALLATKRRQYDIAASHNLPVPRTSFVTSAEQLAVFTREARFPCLMKPVHFREWQRFPAGHPLSFRKVAVASSPPDLKALYLLAASVTPEVVVQEVIEGPDTAKLVYLSCYGRDGRRLGGCVLRQLRTDPIYFGSASVVEPISDPEADASCDAFLRSLNYIGLCEIELKRDSRDGSLKMIEANPRYSVTADAAPYLGLDLGWLHYLDLIGEEVAPVEPEIRDFRHIVLLRDFATFRSYLRAGLLSWKDLIRSYRPPVAFFDFDLHDWRVTAATLAALAKLLVKAYWRE